ERQRIDTPPHAIIEQVNAALKVEPWHTRLPGNSTPTAPGPHRPRDREGRSRETISRARPETISGTRPECGPGAQRRPPDGAESSGALAAAAETGSGDEAVVAIGYSSRRRVSDCDLCSEEGRRARGLSQRPAVSSGRCNTR